VFKPWFRILPFVSFDDDALRRNSLMNLKGSNQTNKQTRWLLARKRIIPTERSLRRAKLLPTFVDTGCYVVSSTGPHSRYSRFSRPEPLLFIQVSRQSSSRGSVDSVLDTRLFRKSGCAGNGIRDFWICSQEL
jgi:hypothetical protein